MGNIVLTDKPAHRHNTQLKESERVYVYKSTVTGRILGFGPEIMTPMYREGWTRTLLYHAYELDKWYAKYRQQELEDLQREDFATTEQESPARNAIKAALRARRLAVGPQDRQFIDIHLRLMDKREDRARERKMRTQSVGLAEQYSADTRAEDIALDSPIFKALAKEGSA